MDIDAPTRHRVKYLISLSLKSKTFHVKVNNCATTNHLVSTGKVPPSGNTREGDEAGHQWMWGLVISACWLTRMSVHRRKRCRSAPCVSEHDELTGRLAANPRFIIQGSKQRLGTGFLGPNTSKVLFIKREIVNFRCLICHWVAVGYINKMDLEYHTPLRTQIFPPRS